jgi:hypothetical protein
VIIHASRTYLTGLPGRIAGMPGVPQLPVSGHISTVKNLHDRMVSFLR